MTAFQYGNNFSFRKTIQELAHPDGIKTFWKRYIFIQEVGRIKMNPFTETGLTHIFPGYLQLTWQIHDGDFNIGSKTGACNGPFSGIASDVQNFFNASRVYFR